MRRALISLLVLFLIAGLLQWMLDDDPPTDTYDTREASSSDGPGPSLRGADGAQAGGHTSSGVDADAGVRKPGENAGGTEDEERPWPHLRIDTVDATTGRYVESSWNVGTGEIVSGPFSPGQVIDEAAQDRQREAAKRSLAAWEAAFRPTGTKSVVGADPETRIRPIALRIPSGYLVRSRFGRRGGHRAVYALARGGFSAHGHLAADVNLVVWVEPLWRERVLHVRATGPDGQPVPGVHVAAFGAAGTEWMPPSERTAPGELRIRGIPHFAEEPVHVRLGWSSPGEDEEPEEEEIFESEEGDMLDDAQVKTRVPHELAPRWEVAVQLESLDEGLLDRLEIEEDLSYEEIFGDSEAARPKEPATLNVTLLGHDGRPIRFASVAGQDVDAEGRVTLEGLAPGRFVVPIEVPGRLRRSTAVTLEPNGVHGLVWREPSGTRVEVLVVDEKDRPLPHARVYFGGLRAFDVTDGVQRFDPHVNANGRRVWHRVEPGEARMGALWGSKRGTANVEFVDGDDARVRIVLR